MGKKIFRKTKNIAEKENRGNNFFGKDKYRQVALIFLGIAFGALLGTAALTLYNRWQNKPSHFQDQSLGKQGEIDPKANTNQAVAAFSAPEALSSPAIYSFSGTVTKVKGSELLVDVFYCGKGHKTYTVLTTKKTAVTKRENRQESKASLSDVKENYNVAIQALEDINKESRLTAREIKIMGEINLSSSDTTSQNK